MDKKSVIDRALEHAETLATGYRGAWTDSDQEIVALALEIKRLRTNASVVYSTMLETEAELNTFRGK